MKLNYNDTILNIKYEKTNSNLGIKDEDSWVKVTMDVKNKDFEVSISKEIITLNELKNLSFNIDDFIKNNSNKKVTFIKNLMVFEFGNEQIEQKLFFDDINKNNFYSLWYTREEIIEFNNMIKDFLINL